jgi:16S rRNA (uracil1498-N3)-methyltransferase
MLARFFVDELAQSGIVTLDEAETRHLRLARRLERGALVALFDGRHSFARQGLVVDQGPRGSRIELTGQVILGTCEPEIELTLATCVPKGERFDWLIEKAVEVGVSRVIPLNTERSVVAPRASKLERLRRTVIEASKQCGRNRLMTIDLPKPWEELVTTVENTNRFVADREGERVSSFVLGKGDCPAILAVGPEGGLTREDRELAFARGWRGIQLGRAFMRIETAAVVGAAMLLCGCKQ